MTAKKRKPPSIDPVLKRLRVGDYDESTVGSLYMACAEALQSGGYGFRWQIDVPGLAGGPVSFGEDDLTLADAEYISRRTGVTTAQLDLYGNSGHFMAFLMAYLVNHLERDSADAEKAVGMIPVNQAADMVKRVAVKDDPKDRHVNWFETLT